jgi:hypothetical protein
MVAGTDRQFRRTDTVLAFAAHETLYDAILQRMKSYHSQPTTGREKFDGLRQGVPQSRQLIIHRDSQGLKRKRRRMEPPSPPSPSYHCLLNDLDQVACGIQWPRLDDGLGNASRLSLLAVVVEEIRQLLSRETVDQISGGRIARRGIKPHVQRSVGHEGEATIGIGQLERRQAKIEQYAIDWYEIMGVRHPFQVSKGGVHKLGALTILGQAIIGQLQSGWVPIHTEQLPVGSRDIQDRVSVPAPPDGGINGPISGRHLEALDDFV